MYAAEFQVRVCVDERGNGKPNTAFSMAVLGTQTLAEFEDAVLTGHLVNLEDYALVLGSKELKDDNATLDALGVTPDCTIHAGKYRDLSRVMCVDAGAEQSRT